MKKDNSISIIRLLALIAIISCHILQGLDLEIAFWVNVGVQVFFFMSGFLYGRKKIQDTEKWYLKNYRKIMLPYLVLLIVILFIDYFSFNFRYANRTIIGSLMGIQGFYYVIPTLSHTWFISYILLCYLITPLLDRLDIQNYSNVKFYFFLAIWLVVPFIFHLFGITSINPAWLFNYILGYCYGAYSLKHSNKEKWFFISSFSIATILLLVFRVFMQYNINEFITKLPTIVINNSEYIKNYSHVLLGSWIFIIFYEIFSKIKIKRNFLLDVSDKYSFYIYLTHQIFILFHMSLLRITDYLFLNIILILMASVGSGIILKSFCNLLEKIIKRILKKLWKKKYI